MKIAVVGGGWSGIAAAVELTAAGQQVSLFEAGRVLGGRARSVHIDGRQLDNGQHILLGAYRDTLALMRRIGADPEQLLLRRPLQVTDNSGFRLALPTLPAPLNVAWGLLTCQGVSLIEKLKTALWMQGIKWRRFQLDNNSTVAEWLDAAGQTGQLRRHLWEPLCLAALNTPAEHASAQRFANVLRDSLGSPRRADTDLLIPLVDLGHLLPIPAQHWLTQNGADIRLGQRVDNLTPQANGIRLADEDFAAVIIATAPQHANKLWPDLAPEFEFEPIATVYLQFPPTTQIAFPLYNLIGRHGQWVIDRDDGLFAAILSGHGDWETLADDALATCLQEELGLAGQASWHKVIREKRATYSCRPGLHHPGPETAQPHLYLAGDYTWSEYPATLEGSVRSGQRAAQAALSRINTCQN